jgi:hypothetical protein
MIFRFMRRYGKGANKTGTEKRYRYRKELNDKKIEVKKNLYFAPVPLPLSAVFVPVFKRYG